MTRAEARGKLAVGGTLEDMSGPISFYSWDDGVSSCGSPHPPCWDALPHLWSTDNGAERVWREPLNPELCLSFPSWLRLSDTSLTNSQLDTRLLQSAVHQHRASLTAATEDCAHSTEAVGEGGGWSVQLQVASLQL